MAEMNEKPMKNTDFFQPGVRALVFDGHEWGKVGDVGDNSRFYKPATIVARYKLSDGVEVVDVQFDRKKSVSKGHFLYGLWPMPLSAGRR